MKPTTQARPAIWRHGARQPGDRARTLPEETAVALTYNRETYAVMMATPADLEDFAVGFSLTEGVIADAGAIEELSLIETEHGVEARMWLDPDHLAQVQSRKRRLAGPTGCGLCGIDSLREAVRPARFVTSTTAFGPADIAAAIEAIEPLQELGLRTRAVHAAALWRPGGGILHLREDVGRHNALDKLVGAASRHGDDPSAALLVLTSRVSIEMVQKACVLGVPALVAISAPTAHAVRLAEAAGLTLVAVARPDGFEVFCGDRRIVPEQAAVHVA